MSTNFHIVIPARYGSTRLLGKPLIDLAGTPMVVRVFRQVMTALPGCDCMVATDDIRICEVLEKYQIPMIMTSNKHVSGTDRISEVCSLMGWEAGDFVINVQGDEPLIPLGLLRAFYDFVVGQPCVDVATVSAPILSHDELLDKNVVKVVSTNKNFALYFSRLAIPCSRDEQINEVDLGNYQRHVGIYAYRVDVIKSLSNSSVAWIENSEKLEQLRVLWMGYSIKVMRWPSQLHHGVDCMKDAEKISLILGGSFGEK